MKPKLPVSLRRALLVSQALFLPALSAATYTVDSGSVTNPSARIYNNLQDLLAGVTFSAGDTIVVKNDDSSVTTGGLPKAVNIVPDAAGTERTIDLSNRTEIGSFVTLTGNATMNWDGIVFQGGEQSGVSVYGGVIALSDGTLTLEGAPRFLDNGVTEIVTGHDVVAMGCGGAIYSFSSAGVSALTMGAGTVFTGNYASGVVYPNGYWWSYQCDNGDGYGYGGAVYSYGGKSSELTIGTGTLFTGNYASGEGYSYFMDSAISGYGYGYGGAIYSEGGEFSSLTIGSGTVFTANYASGKGHCGLVDYYVFSQENTYGYGYGGAIYSKGGISSSLTIESGTVFTGNYASGEGYADIYCSNYYHSHSHIYGYGYGGAVYSYGGSSSSLTIGSGTVFTANYASGKGLLGYGDYYTDSLYFYGYGYGGAIYSYGGISSELRIGSGTVFTANYATGYGYDYDCSEGYGGAIYSEGGTSSELTIGSGTVFTGNYAAGNHGYGYGGAIYSEGGTSSELTIGSGTVFTGNYVSGYGYGGAIYSKGGEFSSLTIGSGTVFTGNYASGLGYGGAICSEGGEFSSLTIGSGTVFTANYVGRNSGYNSEGYGGAIYSKGGTFSELTIGSGTLFRENYAFGNYGYGYGGAIYSEGGTSSSLTMGYGTVFTGNYASGNYGYGGAIYSKGGTSSSLTIGYETDFTGNYATGRATGFGGAVYSWGGTSSELTIEYGTVFTRNYATGSDSLFADSRARKGYGYGGAVYSHGETSSALTIGYGTVFTGNYVSGYGYSEGYDGYDPVIGTGYGYGSGGAVYSYGGRSSVLTIGSGSVFTANYAIASSYGSVSESVYSYGSGGAVYSEGAESSRLTIESGTVFTANYASGNGYGYGYRYSYGYGSGGAVYTSSSAGSSELAIGSGTIYKGNYASGKGYGAVFGSGKDEGYGYGYGGAVYSYGKTSSALTIGSGTLFTGNYAAGAAYGAGYSYGYGYGYAYGGAVYTKGENRSTLTIGYETNFTGNYTTGAAACYGGAVYSESGKTTTLTIEHGTVFTANYATGAGTCYGGAIYTEGAETSALTIGNGTLFTGNYAAGKGTGSVYGSDYGLSYGYGGAVYTRGKTTTLTIGSGGVFTANYAMGATSGSGYGYAYGYAYGGAIYTSGDNGYLWIQDGAGFYENYATTYGGAIYLESGGPLRSTLRAITGDTVFSGNMTAGTPLIDENGKLTGVTKGIANAIHLAGTGRQTLELAPDAGRKILFDDPITGDGLFDLAINRYTGRNTDGTLTGSTALTSGTVTFSGARYIGDEAYLVASRNTNILAQTTVYGGTLELLDSVVLGRDATAQGGNAGSGFTLKEGAVLLNGGNTAHPGVTNTINAETITLESGTILRFDLAAAAVGTTLLQLNGNVDPLTGKHTIDLTELGNGTGIYTVVTRSGGADLDSIEWELTYKGTPVTRSQNQRVFNQLVIDHYADHLDINQITTRRILTWMGYENGIWNETHYNWKTDQIDPIQFLDADIVYFLSGGTVTLEAGTRPQVAEMTVDTDENLRFEGDAINCKIYNPWDDGKATTGQLHKKGNGLLDLTGLTGTSSYQGGVEIEQGIVRIGKQSLETPYVENRGTLELYTPAGGGTTIALASHLGGLGGRIRFQHLGDTLQVGSLSGSQTLYLDVNMRTAASDRVAIQGEASGTHTIIFTNLGDKTRPGKNIYNVVTYGSLGQGSTTGTLFTGSVDHGLEHYELQHRKGDAKAYDLVLTTSGSSTANVLLNIMGSLNGSWFDQLDTLQKRMGELRLASGSIENNNLCTKETGHPMNGNLWVRSSGGRVDSDLGISGVSGFTENQYGGDAGADWVVHNNGKNQYLAGAYLGYQRSERQFAQALGSTGNTDSLYGGLYGTWLNNEGWYADLVLKGQNWDTTWEARSSNGNEQGNYNTWGAGLSAEVGKQWENDKRWFIEPSIQLAWLHANGTDTRTDKGLDLNMDSAEIWQAAARVRAGRTINLCCGGQQIQPYITAGISERGSIGGEIREAGRSWRPNTDGEYVMAGGGMIWQMGSRNQIHVDYEYMFGDKYERPWTLNIGYTRSF